MKLRDLAPLGWWMPQLANLRGSGELGAQFSGTLAAPRVALTVRATGLDAEVPVLGVHLRDGSVNARHRARRATSRQRIDQLGRRQRCA